MTTNDAQDALSRRIDDLQRRVEQLEGAFPEASSVEDVAITSTPDATALMAAGSAAADTAPSPSASAVKDRHTLQKTLRTIQAEATADLSEPTPVAPAEPREPFLELRYIEERIAGRALAISGGAALLLGAVLFLSLAFSRGWIGPELQVVMGLAGGSAGLLAGAVLLVRGDRLVGHVLSAVGLAVISLSLFAASSLYELIDPSMALAGVLLAAAATTAIAIRTESEIVGGFGLVAVLAAPPILGAQPELGTVIYLGAVLTGVSLISLWQTWSWLPPAAFLLTLPQLYLWIDSSPEPAVAIAALLLYWLLMTIAAGGEAFRRIGHELQVTSAPLFLASGAAVIGLGFIVLTHPAERAAYLLVLAALHGVIATFFLRRRGVVDPFGLLAGAYGIAIATAAVPLVMGASLTAVIWAAEAAVLAFFAGRRAHGPSLIGAFGLYLVAAGRLALDALPAAAPEHFSRAVAVAPAEALLLTFVFFVAVGAVIVAVVPVRTSRLLILGFASILAVPIVQVAVSVVGAGVATAVAGWMIVALIAASSPSWLAWLPERSIRWRLGPALRWLRPDRGLGDEAIALTLAGAALAVLVATLRTISVMIEQDAIPPIPFTDAVGVSSLILAGGYVLIGAMLGTTRIGAIGGGLVIGVAGITQVAWPWPVVIWAGLGVAAAALSSRDDGGRYLTYRHASLAALGTTALLALPVAPPTRLIVERGSVEPHPLLVSEASLVLAALAVALGVSASFRRGREARISGLLGAGAGVTALYLLSIGVVDVFAGEAYGLGSSQRARLDELAKEAQVALSVLWTVTGAVVLAVGLVLKRSALRIAGLAALAVATAKVFVFDLASLDVAYRVISLMVLGALLVASAYAWTRMRPDTPDDEPSPRSGDGDTAGEHSHA